MTTNLVVFTFTAFCEISVSQGGADKEQNLLMCYTAFTNIQMPTFRNNLISPKLS